MNVRRVVDRARVSPEDAPEKTATGLAGFACREGHLFFVRASDLETWPEYSEFP